MGKIAVTGPKHFLFFLVFLLPVFSLFCQAPASPRDSRKSFSIGITEFAGTGLSPENVYLKSSLPSQVKEQVAGITSHVFSDEEKSAYRKWIMTAEIQKVLADLDALSQKQDEELFLSKKQFERDKILADYESRRKVFRDKISYYRAFDPALIDFPDEKDAQILTDSGKLLPVPAWSPLEYSGKQDLDVLVTGSIEEIQGYLYLEVRVFHRVLERNIFTFRDAGTREELAEFLLKAAPEIITKLLGREWAGILIDVDPAFSFIKIDGELAGMGTTERNFYKPGEVDIQIDAPGYRSLSKTLVLEPQTKQRLEFTLEKTEGRVLLVESMPPGAQVYLDALWIGTSPLVIPLPEKTSRLLFILGGYNNGLLRVGPESGDRVNATLLSLKVDWSLIRDRKRDRYYGAVAAFILSLPIPVFTFSLARDASGAGRTGDYEFFATSYYWTMFISAALFVNMISELLRYVQSSDRPAG